MSATILHPVSVGAMALHGASPVEVFFAQVVLLIVVGRLLGECMQRLGQPAVIGQLLAGIILGPSVFGAIAPESQQAIFPAHSSDRQMLNAVAELGVLMLLLLTGMETDLALVKRVRRTAAIVSAAGIVIPFVCGYGLGELLPDRLLPDPNRRLMTSLFLATALSISSVKIVAVVLREVDFLRRNLGQVILAAAILDDTIGWTILSFIGGLAAQGKIVLGPALVAVIGTAVFLLFCFTVGHRWVARVIRWTNDNFVIEMPVISVILILMLLAAELTHLIGVHTVLGAFVAGIMVGQSPILTKHIEEQLRGLIVALFMPVFFGAAGLSIDLKVLGDTSLLELAMLVIGIASFGKLGGCYIGSRLARLNHPESLAVGFAMNARGSTEVILATIGLTIGVLDQRLFTIIVLMAVVTTLCMPPLLRWSLGRVPIRSEEKERLEAEAAEEKDLLPKVERVLVGLDSGANGQVAARIAGSLLGARHLTATVISADKEQSAEAPMPVSQLLMEAAERAARAVKELANGGEAQRKSDIRDPIAVAAQEAKIEKFSVRERISVLALKDRTARPEDSIGDAILAEAKNGYGLLVLGVDRVKKRTAVAFAPAVEKVLSEFVGPIAVLVRGSNSQVLVKANLERILVPMTGIEYSRFGAEIAVAAAKGCGATITALHVSTPPHENELLRRPTEMIRTGRELLSDVIGLGQREKVRVVSKTVIGPANESVILRQARLGAHQLIVVGTKASPGSPLGLGNGLAALVDQSPCPVLIIRA